MTEKDIKPCGTCEAAEWFSAREDNRETMKMPPATHVSTGAGCLFYLCPLHAQLGLIAGWNPVEIDSERGIKEIERFSHDLPR